MSTSRRPVRHRSHSQAIGRTTFATPLVILLLLTSVSRASDEATSADATAANESAAAPQQSASDSHARYDAKRKPLGSSPQLSPEELYERVAPSVVTIRVKDENGEWIAGGSGFFIDEALLSDRHDRPATDELFAKYVGDNKSVQGAYVLTNYHVIRPAVFVELALHNDNFGSAPCIVADDEKADLALLYVTVPTSLTVNGIPLAPNDPRVMTKVFAIGSPLGLTGTASEGKVSAFRELFGDDHWLQTTAPISPGSSGGPLLLADGSLVGVTTLGYAEGQNLNFAIPASAVRKFMATAKFRPRRPYEGTSIRLQEEMAFTEMNDAVKSQRSNDTETSFLTRLLQGLGGIQNNEAERTAVATLTDAWREIEKRPANDGELLAHYQKIIASAQGTEASLPNEFKYLMHYVVGKANVCAARCAEPNDAMGATQTEGDRIRYRLSQHAKDATCHLAQATERKPAFPAAYEQLYHHHRLCGNWADALLAADALVKRMPRCGKALALRAECYRVIGQADSARQDLEAATDLSPANGNLHCQLAEVLVALGEYGDAIDSYEWALACDAPQLRNKVHYHLGLAYRKSGNVEKALAEFTTAKALGWSADVCESQIAECRQYQVLPVATLPALASSLQEDRVTVYVTKTGKKYHRAGCNYLGKSKIPMSLTGAARIYEPCSHCHPPVPEASDPNNVNVAVSQRPGPHD